MDYKFWFFMLIAFVLGRLSKLKFYMGTSKERYKQCDFGVLLREK